MKPVNAAQNYELVTNAQSQKTKQIESVSYKTDEIRSF